MTKCSNQRCNLILSKTLFFITALSTVGWNRFQNNFFIDNGLSNTEIGMLKTVGLVSKIIGEPALCMLADATNLKVVFAIGVVMSIYTMEILRTAAPLTFNIVFYVKILRTFVSPIGTLTTTSSLHLIQGSSEGFGEQRAFGSVAWGIGALLIGALIDIYGMNSLFYYTYCLNLVMLIVILIAVPNKATRDHSIASESNKLPKKRGVGLITDTPSPADLLERGVAQHKHHFLTDHPSEDDFTPLVPKYDTPPTTSPSTDKHALISGTNSIRCNSVLSAICRQGSFWLAQVVGTLRPYWLFCRHEHLQCLFFNIFVYGICMTAIDTFLYVAVERDFSASRTFNGLLTAVSVVGTVPAFWYSDRVIQSYGHNFVILTAQMVCCVRLFLSALIWHCPSSVALGLTLLLQLSHSVCFGLYWATVVDLVTSSAHSNILNGVVAMTSALYFTIGGAVGNVMWGTAYDYFGSMACVFLIAGGMVGGIAFVHWSRNFNKGSGS